METRLDSDTPSCTFTVPESLPLLPIRDAVVFPSMILPLFVGRDVSIQAIEAALEGDRLLALVTQRDPDVEEPGPEESGEDAYFELSGDVELYFGD